MARMKIEFLADYRTRHAPSLRDKLIAYLPRYARWARRMPALVNFAAGVGRRFIGFTEKRELPAWRGDAFVDRVWPKTGEREVVLFVDTFSRYFEPDNARAAIRVLQAAGYRVHTAMPVIGDQPLCCGRTFLAAGMIEEAKTEARRMLEALGPWVGHGVPIVGLEPSCLFTLRDEYTVLFQEAGVLAKNAFLFEEFLAGEADAGRLKLELKPLPAEALLHGHCHQKAFGAMGAVERALRLVPELRVKTIDSSCCGMAGNFGYEAEHYEVSMRMAEASLLPAVRKASPDSLLIADGTSCRHQIAHGAGREALHVARVLEQALA